MSDAKIYLTCKCCFVDECKKDLLAAAAAVLINQPLISESAQIQRVEGVPVAADAIL